MTSNAVGPTDDYSDEYLAFWEAMIERNTTPSSPIRKFEGALGREIWGKYFQYSPQLIERSKCSPTETMLAVANAYLHVAAYAFVAARYKFGDPRTPDFATDLEYELRQFCNVYASRQMDDTSQSIDGKAAW